MWSEEYYDFCDSFKFCVGRLEEIVKKYPLNKIVLRFNIDEGKFGVHEVTAFSDYTNEDEIPYNLVKCLADAGTIKEPEIFGGGVTNISIEYQPEEDDAPYDDFGSLDYDYGENVFYVDFSSSSFDDAYTGYTFDCPENQLVQDMMKHTEFYGSVVFTKQGGAVKKFMQMDSNLDKLAKCEQFVWLLNFVKLPINKKGEYLSYTPEETLDIPLEELFYNEVKETYTSLNSLVDTNYWGKGKERAIEDMDFPTKLSEVYVQFGKGLYHHKGDENTNENICRVVGILSGLSKVTCPGISEGKLKVGTHIYYPDPIFSRTLSNTYGELRVMRGSTYHGGVAPALNNLATALDLIESDIKNVQVNITKRVNSWKAYDWCHVVGTDEKGELAISIQVSSGVTPEKVAEKLSTNSKYTDKVNEYLKNFE